MSERLALELGRIGDARAARAAAQRVARSAARASARTSCVEGQGVDDVHCAIGRTKERRLAAQGPRLAPADARQRRARPARRACRRRPDRASARARLEVRAASTRACALRAREPARRRAAPRRRRPHVGGYRIERAARPRRHGLGLPGGAGEPRAGASRSRCSAPSSRPTRDFVRRFQAEARAAAALSHPNVVDGLRRRRGARRHYLSMEYMDRGNLEERVAAPAAARRWRAVARHPARRRPRARVRRARGIVHRDIKPANLMQTPTGTTKIADLGLATTLEPEADRGRRRAQGLRHAALHLARAGARRAPSTGARTSTRSARPPTGCSPAARPSRARRRARSCARA